MKHDRHPVKWRSPAPLWDAATGTTGDAPVVLRFAGLGFVDELRATLARAPADLAQLVAERKAPTDDGPSEDLHLFRPIHDRFYLVAATLVCATYGLPERALDRGGDDPDRVSLLVRRLVSEGTAAEGWDGDDQWGTWRPLDDPRTAAGFEERLPLFPVPYELAGRRRTLHAGHLPVTRAAVWNDHAGARYVTHCLYERPRCGPLDEPVLSAASASFRIAARGDASAPWWPIPAQRARTDHRDEPRGPRP